MKTVITKKNKTLSYSLTPKERLAIWQKAKGMWKNKKPDPIKTLKKIRAEMDRY